MAVKIAFNPLDARSVDKAISQLEEFQRNLDGKCKRLRNLVAERIKWSASAGFSTALTSDVFMGGSPPANDVAVSVNDKGDITVVIAEGEQAVFIEFGAGVYYNGAAGSSPHEWGSQNGFLIGEYGKGHGKKNAWALPTEMWSEFKTDDKGNSKPVPMLTRGTPAAMPMYRGLQDTLAVLEDLAEEVFR